MIWTGAITSTCFFVLFTLMLFAAASEKNTFQNLIPNYESFKFDTSDYEALYAFGGIAALITIVLIVTLIINARNINMSITVRF